MKKEVWRAILQEKMVVRNAEEFYQTAQKVCQKISILYVSSASLFIVYFSVYK